MATPASHSSYWRGGRLINTAAACASHSLAGRLPAHDVSHSVAQAEDADDHDAQHILPPVCLHKELHEHWPRPHSH
jgi:hypothetical protein